MKVLQKLLVFWIALSLLLSPFASAFAQMPVRRSLDATIPQTPPTTGSSSFGSKDRAVPKPQVDKLQELDTFPREGLQGLFYQVHILGEVQKPGTYRIPASTRLSEALQLAGGVMERGSERRIELRRQEGGGRKVDLLSFKSFGNLDNNPYLLDNDVIFVPLRQRVVEIQGTVRRPGVYEVKNEKTIQDLMTLAGGFTPGVGNPVPIKVIRFKNGEKQVIDIPNTEEERSHFQVENADVIVFPHILTEKNTFDYNVSRLPGDNELFYPSYEERVFVLGAVASPGPYPFNPYYDVRQYLTLAGGTTKQAKVKKIKLLTTEGKTVKANEKAKINPGDTIVVPEKYMAPESVVSLVLGITTSILGITTTVLTLAR